MMNFDYLFATLKDLESTAIAFRDRQPVYYESHFGPGNFTFRKADYKKFAESKIMSHNNGIMAWIDGDTMYVIPMGLGNAEKILAAAEYRWTLNDGFGNNYYVPLSNGQYFNPYEQAEMYEKWKLLKAVSRACTEKI